MAYEFCPVKIWRTSSRHGPKGRGGLLLNKSGTKQVTVKFVITHMTSVFITRGAYIPLEPMTQITLPPISIPPSLFRSFLFFPFHPLSLPSPFHIPCSKSSYVDLGKRCKLLQWGPGPNPGRKPIFRHLRVSKRTSWQHLSASPQHFQ